MKEQIVNMLNEISWIQLLFTAGFLAFFKGFAALFSQIAEKTANKKDDKIAKIINNIFSILTWLADAGIGNTRKK